MISYEWLKNEKAPKVLVQAVKMLGTKEIVGAKHNPVILGWQKNSIYKTFTTPMKYHGVAWLLLLLVNRQA